MDDFPLESILCLPTIAEPIFERYGKDLQQMESIQADIWKCKELIRDAFLQRGYIKKLEIEPSDREIHVVDGSMASVTKGEFKTLMALAVNVSTCNESYFDFEYQHVFAPNCDMFNAIGSPIMAACELIALSKKWDGYTLYDGSFQSLNMNLGNLFRMQSEKGDISEYTTVIDDLFDAVVKPVENKPALYSNVYGDKSSDIFAISKRSTSTYAYHRIKDKYSNENADLEDLREALGKEWFVYPKSDRLIFNAVLKAGEYVGPIPFSKIESKSGKNNLFGLSSEAQKANPALKKPYEDFQKALHFTFFKPNDAMPSLRVEMLKTIPAWSEHKTFEEKHQEILAIVLGQSQVAGLMEPLGLWLADKLAKQIQSFNQVYGGTNAINFPDLFQANRTEDIICE